MAVPEYTPKAERVPGNRSTWLWSILSGLLLFIVAFVGGILFTIFLLTHSMANTPLSFIQQPILAASGIPADDMDDWLNLEQSFQYIDKYYYQQDAVHHKEMLYSAAEAAIAQVGDRFTAFNRPAVASVNNGNISGKYVGIGIVGQLQNGRYTVKEVVDPGPAAEAGIQGGDILVAVGGITISTDITDVATISTQLQGQENTQVKVSFERPSDNNKVTDYTLTRRQIIAPSVEAYMLPNTTIAYIGMNKVFGENTMAEFDQKVGALAKNNPTGYILDMRDNGGGLITTAQQLLGRFLPDGIAYYKDAPAKDIHMEAVNLIPSTGLKLYDKPLVILVNGNSASATEITTAALRDRQRATVIGQQTYGKGSAQDVIALLDGSYLRVTVEHWFTPNKINMYDSKGIKPDIEVGPANQAQIQAGQDPQLDRAVQFLNTGK